LALFCLLLDPLMTNSLIVISELGIFLLWVASILSVLSGYQYYKRIPN